MPNIKPMMERLETTNRVHGLIRRGDRIVVGVSGGPDSMALLSILFAVRKKYAIKLYCAHLNHGLSRQASQYEKMASSLAKKLEIPFFVKKVNVKKRAASTGKSIEEAGRDERYSFFDEVARRCRANKIATAHTLDDQAETVLFRIVRGAGLRGLVGIPAKRRHGRYEIIRPLIDCEKSEILRFLKVSGIAFCIDKSNNSADFTRNRVRHELLPLMEKRFNPQTKKMLCNLQVAASDAQAWIDQEADKVYARHAKKAGARGVRLSLRALEGLHPALKGELILRAIGEIKDDTRRISRSHVASILQTAANSEKDLETHLPGNITVFKGKSDLVFRIGAD